MSRLDAQGVQKGNGRHGGGESQRRARSASLARTEGSARRAVTARSSERERPLVGNAGEPPPCESVDDRIKMQASAPVNPLGKRRPLILP
jgi:hypothetical protein